MERSTILALVKRLPPGKPGYERTGAFEAEDARADAPAEWTLDTLTAAARDHGIQVARSQVRCIFLREGVRWRRTHPWATSNDADFVPEETRSSALTDPPAGATVLCLDALGPVTPRAFPPAPGWSPDGHRSEAHLAYGRGSDKVWVYGALRVHDGQVLTQTAPARNTTGYLALLAAVAQANPDGDLSLIADNLSSHTSQPIQDWLAEHPRVHPSPLPVGASWLNLIEGWWRIFRRKPSRARISPITRTWPLRRVWPRTSSMPAPVPGSGGAHLHHTARSVAGSYTAFDERRIRARLMNGPDVVLRATWWLRCGGVEQRAWEDSCRGWPICAICLSSSNWKHRFTIC